MPGRKKAKKNTVFILFTANAGKNLIDREFSLTSVRKVLRRNPWVLPKDPKQIYPFQDIHQEPGSNIFLRTHLGKIGKPVLVLGSLILLSLKTRNRELGTKN